MGTSDPDALFDGTAITLSADSTACGGPNDALFSDLDGDGDIDFLSVCSLSNNMLWMPNLSAQVRAFVCSEGGKK